MFNNNFIEQLTSEAVPPDYQERFNSKYAVMTYIRDIEHSLEQVYYWLAYEAQQQNPDYGIIQRLHQRYSNMKMRSERQQLVESFGE